MLQTELLALPELSHDILLKDVFQKDFADIIAGLATLKDKITSPWAILLVRFSDDTGPDPARRVHEDLFTSSGSGSLNMVDFFKDMSHGKVDTSGTQVFGWLTLPVKRSDYFGNGFPVPAGKFDRGGLIDIAKTAATGSGVPLNNFSGVVVACAGQLDLFGVVGGMAAVCDDLSLTPSLLGQEMGHGYGLDHARLRGSSEDYRDPWDVMSTAAFPFMQAPHPEFTTVGPALNAWNMRSRGWLDETRVWTTASDHTSSVITLRPLHRIDLPGLLAAELGPYLIEFRVPARWDAAIPRAAVLVHTFSDNHSYLVPADSGSQDMIIGDKLTSGSPLVAVGPFSSIEVLGIDPQNLTATIRVTHRPAAHIPILEGPVGFESVELQALTAGGDRSIIIVGGKVATTASRGPDAQLLGAVARYLNITTSEQGVATSLTARREALTAVIRSAIALHAESSAISEPPPGYGASNQTT